MGPRLTGWPRPISWNEFKDVATRPAGEDEDAQIDTQTAQPERVGVAREQGRFRLGDFEVRLKVVRDNSWVVVSQKNDTLLAHEQGHFDITGLVARDLVKALGALRGSTTDELQREVSRLYEAYDAWAKSLSKQYDAETNHGRNAKVQSEWESRIRTCIQQGTSLGTPPC
jgi:predicted secreted Zn-dependent protease